MQLKGEKALKPKGARNGDRGGRAAILLAVLLAQVALSIPLQAPKAGAFPQLLTRDYSFTALGYGEFAAADIDKDGHLDFVLSDRASTDGNSSISIYLYKPVLGEYLLNATVKVSGQHDRMTVDDVDNNGTLDLVVHTLSPSTIQVFLQQQGSGFSLVRGPSKVIYAPDAVDFVVGPLTGSASGHDIAVVYPGNVTVYSYIGPPRYYDTQVSSALADTAGYSKAVVADADGDTLPDLVLGSPNGVKIFYGRAGFIDPGCATNCSVHLISGTQSGDVSMAVGDMTSDGRRDIVLAVSNRTTFTGTLVILARSGDSGLWNFTEVFRDSRDLTDKIVIADLNYDGSTDIAVVLYSAGNVAYFYQQSGGIFRGRVDLQLEGPASSGSAEYILAGDFPAGGHAEDGYADIAVRAAVAGNSTVSIFHQQDAPVGFARPIPYECPHDCVYFNQGGSGNDLIDLNDYFTDDHGPIVYSITYQESPTTLHAILDPDGHHLDFTATSGWFGIASFRVAANDIYPGHAAIESNNFTVMVNAAPSITSAPPRTLTLGEEYRYLPSTDDPFPLDDYQRFELLGGPPGISVDANSGLMRWTPTAGGVYTISFRAVDSFGAASAPQSFDITVTAAPSNPPDTFGIPIPTDPASVAVIGLAITTILLIGAIAAISENAKYGLLLIVVPLYSKIRREKVLDHFIRGQIFGYIMANPGEHYNSIKQALDITNGSLAHHLRTLERERFIKSKRFGLYRRFYPWAMRVPEDGYFQLNEIQKNILDLCRHQPGVSQKELAASLNLTPPTINYHISILAEHGYVRVIRRGRRTQVFVLKEGHIGAH